ncbi:MAG: AI-2E family transporter [Spirochaetia bacterium]|nr:AI-2E family transporter [Spirochaetia bacterium]
MAADESTGSTIGRQFIIALVLLAIAVFLFMVRSFILTVLMAIIFSALLMPLQLRLTRAFKGKKQLAAALLVLLAILVVGLPLIGLFAVVVQQALKVGTAVAPWVSQQFSGELSLIPAITELLPFMEWIEPYSQTIGQQVEGLIASLGNLIVNSIPDLTKGTLSFTLSAFVFLYAMYYFLAYGRDAIGNLYTYLPLRHQDSRRLFDRGFTVIRASLKGILVIGLLQGVLIAIPFALAGIEGAVFWGAVVVILSAIPGIGAPLIWIPAAVYLFSSGRIGAAVALTLWGTLVVGLVDNILRPIVVGRDAKLPDLLILISILGGLSLFGASGILVGPVLASIVITALDIYRQMYTKELHETSDSR